MASVPSGRTLERADMLPGGVVDVQKRFVRREGETVRQGEVVGHEVQGSIGGETVDAVTGLLLSRDGLGPPARGPGAARMPGSTPYGGSVK